MKYNWAKVVEVFRELVIKNVIIKGKTKEESLDLRLYFEIQMRATDQFHPFDSDVTLSRALQRMPNYCNYRSIESYWAWKDGRMFVEDGLYDMFLETFNLVESWFDNKMEHPPGYTGPETVTWKLDADSLAQRAFYQIIRAAKTA